MEKEICKIYHNPIGIAFRWQIPFEKTSENVQVVFNNMGFHLSKEEIELFSYQVACSRESISSYDRCAFKKDCKNILLETPSASVSLAVNENELEQLDDLLNGTLFWINLKDYLKNHCKN
tara:strand:+ start:800 stop:1159 length:360 start_codon:yes stop_codon:yes gene_type:complete